MAQIGDLQSEAKSLLSEGLNPVHLDIIDESHLHSRRTVDRPETHFKVVIVSDAFLNLNRVKRQQMVFSILGPIFQKGLHALTQSTYTVEEWHKNPNVIESPECGHKRPVHE